MGQYDSSVVDLISSAPFPGPCLIRARYPTVLMNLVGPKAEHTHTLPKTHIFFSLSTLT